MTNADTAAPLAGVTVEVYYHGFKGIGAFEFRASTNTAGVYTITGLPAGTYFARTYVPSTLNNIDEAYNDIACPACVITSTTPITVTGTATTPNINFALAPGGGIAGTA